MLTKIWCFASGGALLGIGACLHEVGKSDPWDAIIGLAVFTLVFAIVQTVKDL